jgi:hypothetical protein
LFDLLQGARPRKFQRFRNQIEPGSDPTLHFLHIL